MKHLLSTTESFTVACSSVLKELAVSCDLTDLEQVLILFVCLFVTKTIQSTLSPQTVPDV